MQKWDCIDFIHVSRFGLLLCLSFVNMITPYLGVRHTPKRAVLSRVVSRAKQTFSNFCQCLYFWAAGFTTFMYFWNILPSNNIQHNIDRIYVSRFLSYWVKILHHSESFQGVWPKLYSIWDFGLASSSSRCVELRWVAWQYIVSSVTVMLLPIIINSFPLSGFTICTAYNTLLDKVNRVERMSVKWL